MPSANWIYSLVLTLFFSVLFWPGGLQAQATRTDEAAVRAQIASIEAALNERDAEAYTSLYLPDGDSVAGTGPLNVGHQAIREDIESMFSTLPDSVPDLGMSVNSVRFIHEDVAVVDADVASTGGRATFVLVRASETWLIASTRLLPGERV